jgi:hypothetical protein
MLSASNNGTSETINTDSSSIGVGNQSMNTGDNLRIDFVTHMTTDAGNTTLGFDYGQHVDTNLFDQTVPQVVGSVTAVSFRVWALETADTDTNAPDSNPAGGFANSTITNITEVGIQGANAATQPMLTFDISGLAAGQSEALAYGVSVTKEADGSVIFSGVTQGERYEIGTGSGTFNAVNVEDTLTKAMFDLGVFALGTTNFGNPVNLSYDLQIQDADGDTVALPKAINITLNPSGQQAQTQTVQHTMMVSSTPLSSSTSTSHLGTTNDNHPLDTRAFAVGQNTTLMAALAAAGLETEHSRLGVGTGAASTAHVQQPATFHAAAVTANAVEASHAAAPSHIIQPAVTTEATHAPASASHLVQELLQGVHPVSSGDAHHAAPMTELLHGTGHVHATAANAAAAVTAAVVAMPSAQQLAAAMGAHSGAEPQTVAADGAQHEQVVGKVLVDALHGGDSHAASVDTLLNGLPGHSGPHDSLEALASHGLAAVSFGHTGYGTPYGHAHAMLTVEMAMHAHAAPAHG